MKRSASTAQKENKGAGALPRVKELEGQLQDARLASARRESILKKELKVPTLHISFFVAFALCFLQATAFSSLLSGTVKPQEEMWDSALALRDMHRVSDRYGFASKRTFVARSSRPSRQREGASRGFNKQHAELHSLCKVAADEAFVPT